MMMNSEFEALVSHLVMIGGRAVSASPPGALVQLAPRDTAPSRARDAAFVLVLPHGDTQAKPVFYEQLARWAVDRYFDSQGSVTASLRSALASINQNLYQHNQGHAPDQHFYADMVALVMRKEEVYIARTGLSFVALWHEDGLKTFPQDLQAKELTQGKPLGVLEEPNIKVNRFHIAANNVLAMGSPVLARQPGEILAAVGQQGNLQRTMNGIKGLALQDATMMLMQFVLPDAPNPQDVVVAQPAPVQPEAVAQPVVAPMEEIPIAAEPASDSEAPAPQSDPVNEVPLTAAVPEAVVPEAPKASRRGGFFRRGRNRDASTANQPASSHVSVPVSEDDARAVPLSEVLKENQAALTGAASAAKPALDGLQSGSRNIFVRFVRAILRGLRGVALRLSRVLDRLRGILDAILPEPEPGKGPAIPTPVAAATAIVLPVLIVLAVVAFSLNTQDETAFERCLSQAGEAQGAAEIIEANAETPEEAQETWFDVIEVVNRCLPRRPEDPSLLAIRREAQARLDSYAQVVRCDMVLLRRYQPGADVRGPILRNGVDLYTLDTTRSSLFRDTLSDDGRALPNDSVVIAQRGSAIGDVVVRDLVDIAWLTDSGVARGNELVALDKNGAIVTFSPTFPPADAQWLVGNEHWVSPNAIDTWQGRLYILDPFANQVWRYSPQGGEFPAAPDEYFVGDNQPSLTEAVDLAIDQSGYLYILFRDGSVRKFYSGSEEPFEFTRLPNGGYGKLGNATGLYLDTGLIARGFYVLDGDMEIIHETTTGGTFIQSYRAADDLSLRDVSGLTVDPSAESIYVAARDALYYMDRCRF